jgi:hypothetical protein
MMTTAAFVLAVCCSVGGGIVGAGRGELTEIARNAIIST